MALYLYFPQNWVVVIETKQVKRGWVPPHPPMCAVSQWEPTQGVAVKKSLAFFIMNGAIQELGKANTQKPHLPYGL